MIYPRLLLGKCFLSFIFLSSCINAQQEKHHEIRQSLHGLPSIGYLWRMLLRVKYCRKDWRPHKKKATISVLEGKELGWNGCESEGENVRCEYSVRNLLSLLYALGFCRSIVYTTADGMHNHLCRSFMNNCFTRKIKDRTWLKTRSGKPNIPPFFFF